MMSSKEKTWVPREVPIDSLAFVGKSWRKRGFRYWALRSMATLFAFLMTCMMFAMAAGITTGIINSGASPWIVIPIVVAASVLSSFKTGQSIARNQRERSIVRDHEMWAEDARERRSRGRRVGAGSGALGYGLSALGGLGGLLIVVCMPVAVGAFPVLLWYYLKPLLPGELRARRKLARWLTLQGRQDEIPAGWGDLNAPA
ncbi:hypothetical protein [Streptomyces sp. NPDC001537]